MGGRRHSHRAGLLRFPHGLDPGSFGPKDEVRGHVSSSRRAWAYRRRVRTGRCADGNASARSNPCTRTRSGHNKARWFAAAGVEQYVGLSKGRPLISSLCERAVPARCQNWRGVFRCCLIVAFTQTQAGMGAPLEGWRHVKVTDRHTAVDYAHVLKELADHYFPNAKTIVLVQDNLNIHSKGSLYEAFPAAEARRLVERFEWHYTPKHGSWLDLAESELGVLSSQCLDRRIPNKESLIEEIAAWELDRNANHSKANWQFSTQNARIKLKHLYPAI